VKVTADTNVLLRLLVGDDEDQQRAAAELVEGAELVAVGVQTLAELVWVLRRSYGVSRKDTAAAIRRIVDTANVRVDRPAVDAGLACMEAGGDFADGLIAHEGAWLGGETFASFDVKAVKAMHTLGRPTMLLR
jgi:predicted nucleic-acid-binding protein